MVFFMKEILEMISMMDGGGLIIILESLEMGFMMVMEYTHLALSTIKGFSLVDFLMAKAFISREKK